MSYDAGSIVASADLDRTPFQQGLRLLRQEAQDFERTKVTATADLDTKKADAEIIDFQSRLKKMTADRTPVQVVLDKAAATRGVVEFSDRLDALRAKVAEAKVTVDDQAAKDRLTALDIQLRRVGMITSRPNVRLEGVERANLTLDSLELRLAALDTKKADAEIIDFQSRLKKMTADRTPVQVVLDKAAATRGVVEFSDRLDALRAKVAEAKVTVDDQAAKDRLTALDIQLRRVGMITSRPNVRLEGVERANLTLDSLELRLAALSHTGGGGSIGSGGAGTGGPGFFARAASRAPSAMGLGLAAAVPAALPIAGLAAGAGASLLTPLASGLAGVAPFALVAAASIKKVSTDIKNLNTLEAAYNAATTNKQRAAVLAKEHDLWKSMDPAQRQAVKNVQGLDAAWERFQKALEPQTFGAMSSGIGILTTLMKDFRPVTKAVGDEVINLEDRVSEAFKDPFWHNFFTKFLTVEAPLAVHTLGIATGNFFTGLAHLTKDFAPLGHDFEAMIVRWSDRFEHWTEGSGPGKFVDWVEANGPGAAQALTALAHGVEGLGKGLMPIGQIELKALTPVLNFIGDLGDDHPRVITAVGGALLTVAVGLKAIAAVKGIAGVLGGIRGLGRGGGIGGAISKAEPVPVYVTNWGGGPGGMPGPGGGKEPRVGKKTLPLGLIGPLTAAYIATQGGDQAPGQGSIVSSDHGIVGQKSAVNYTAQVLAKLLGPNFGDASHSAGSFTVLDTQKAVSTIEEKGTKDQIAALEDLAKKYDNVRAALKEYKQGVDDNKQSQADLNQILGVTKGKIGDADSATHHFATSLLGLSKGAKTAGRQIGTDLGQGLIQSIEAQIPHATQAGKLLVSQTVKQMRLAAEANSPSKATARLGKDLADGLVLGFTQRMTDVRGLFEQATGGMVSRLALILARAQQDAQNRLAGARSQLAADRSARRGLASGIAGGLAGSADIGGAYVNGRVGNLGGYLGNFAHGDHRLLRDLKLLDDKHLDPALLEQIANAGPVAGVALAENILSGKSGSIHHLNRLEGQIHSYSRRSGGIVAGARYDGQIQSDRADVRDMLHELRALNDNIDSVKQILRKSPHDYADALDAALSGAHHRHQARSS